MHSITGTWQLIHSECIAEDGRALPPPYGGGDTCMGLLSLRDDGRLVCVLCDSRQELPAGQSREYNSYCGAYHYDGKQLGRYPANQARRRVEGVRHRQVWQ